MERHLDRKSKINKRKSENFQRLSEYDDSEPRSSLIEVYSDSGSDKTIQSGIGGRDSSSDEDGGPKRRRSSTISSKMKKPKRQSSKLSE